MNFAPTSSILAVHPAQLAQVALARESYGSLVPLRPADPASPQVVCLLGHRDRADSPDLRAGQLGESVSGIELTDGRLAFTGHFTTAFLAALGTDPQLAGCEILTPEALTALLPEVNP